MIMSHLMMCVWSPFDLLIVGRLDLKDRVRRTKDAAQAHSTDDPAPQLLCVVVPLLLPPLSVPLVAMPPKKMNLADFNGPQANDLPSGPRTAASARLRREERSAKWRASERRPQTATEPEGRRGARSLTQWTESRDCRSLRWLALRGAGEVPRKLFPRQWKQVDQRTGGREERTVNRWTTELICMC
jgi:hypothetical protein